MGMVKIRFPLDAWQLLQHAMATAEVPASRRYPERAVTENDRIVAECPDAVVQELRNFFDRRADETKTLIDDAVRHGKSKPGLAEDFAAAVHGVKAVDEAMGIASQG